LRSNLINFKDISKQTTTLPPRAKDTRALPMVVCIFDTIDVKDLNCYFIKKHTPTPSIKHAREKHLHNQNLSNATLNHQHESATKLECEAKVRANNKVLIR